MRIALALAQEPDQDGLLNEKPRSQKEKILSKDVVPLLFFSVLLMVLGAVFLFSLYIPEGENKARTIVLPEPARPRIR